MSSLNYVRRKPKEKLNILTFPTHRRYETELAKTGHNFYAAQISSLPGTQVDDYGIDNYHIMPLNEFYPYDNFDLILSQHRFGQFEVAHKINQKLKVPIITLEHTTITPDLSPSRISAMSQMIGDVNVFISDDSNRKWSSKGIDRNNFVIKHSIDTETFKPVLNRDGVYVLTVANDFKKRDYCLNYSLWKSIKDIGKHEMHVVGKNADEIDIMFIEEPNPNKLAQYYSECVAYVNTTSYSPIPMSLLEAMSCECPVVTTPTCGITEFVEDGVNGMIAETPEEFDKCLETIKANRDLAFKMGKNARQTILDKCSTDRFVNQWNQIFNKTYEASL